MFDDLRTKIHGYHNSFHIPTILPLTLKVAKLKYLFFFHFCGRDKIYPFGRLKFDGFSKFVFVLLQILQPPVFFILRKKSNFFHKQIWSWKINVIYATLIQTWEHVKYISRVPHKMRQFKTLVFPRTPRFEQCICIHKPLMLSILLMGRKPLYHIKASIFPLRCVVLSFG